MSLVLPLLITVCSASVLKDTFQVYVEGQTRFFWFPGYNDKRLHLVDAEEPADYEYLRSYAEKTNNEYFLYTRSNPTIPQILKLNETDRVRQSSYDSAKTTVFIAHGWRNDWTSAVNKELTAAFLQDSDVNVIVVDWSKLAGQGYITAKSGTAQAGKELGQFIIWLSTLGLKLKKTHLVGFSLGAHLVGNAGRETKGRIKRITGLDPAGPLCQNKDRLVPTDAQYVEVIHTNTALLGYADPCGHADHYPNGGSAMPGCWLNSCSHSMAWEYMAATLKYKLYANECKSLVDVKKNTCFGDLVPMGNSDLEKSRSGIYRLNTPYAFPY